MSESSFIKQRPTRASFKGGRAIHDIYDDQGVKWIAKGQFLTEKQIEVALEKGSLTRQSFDAAYVSSSRASLLDLKPTFADIVELTGKIESVSSSKKEDIRQTGKLSTQTEESIAAASESIMELISSNQFSPYKLIGLTSFLYNEASFAKKRPFLKALNNSGTQHTLFKGIMNDNLEGLVVANLLNPFEQLAEEQGVRLNDRPFQISREAFRSACEASSQQVLHAIEGTRFDKAFIHDLIRYFSPHLYFTSPEIRLFQQINQYVNFAMPETLTEEMPFKLSEIPAMNLASFFKEPAMGGGLGIEGARILQYVGLIPSGTAVQFNNREKGVVIAPKSKDTLYCAVITGMDGQPMVTPSLREIPFRQLNKEFRIISSTELPLNYEQHSHEKIWKMHIVHENLKNKLDS